MSAGRAIHCPACGENSVLRREAVYDGFRKTGEKLTCFGCGHAFGSESDVPYTDVRPRLFTDADRSAEVRVFSAEDELHTCRYCIHYVVNPFVQRCSLHQRLVEATDSCPDFEATPDDADEASD